MLGKYLKINGEQIPNPVSFSDNYEQLKNTFVTEAGTTLVEVTRSDKYNCSMSFNLSSYWKNKIEEYAKEVVVTLTVKGKDRTVMLEGFNATLVENSETCDKTDGYWQVSLTATEL